MSKDQLKGLIEAMTRARLALTDTVSDEDLSVTVNLLDLRIGLLAKELEAV